MKTKIIIVSIFFSFTLIPTFVSADIFVPSSMNVQMTLDGEKITEDSPKAMLLLCLKKDSKSNNTKFGDINNLYSDRYFEFISTIPNLVIDEYNQQKNCYWQPSFNAILEEYENSEFFFRLFFPPGGDELKKSNFKLAIYLPTQDKLYISPETTRKNFRSSYEANILSNSGTIEIKDITTFWRTTRAHEIKNFILALILTQIIELLFALIYLNSNKLSKKILFSLFILNFISLPIVWFIASLFKTDLSVLAIFIGEIFAFMFESCLIYLLNKNRLSLKQSFHVGFIINTASFIMGGIIFQIATIIFYL